MANEWADKYLKSLAPEIFGQETGANTDEPTELEDLENPMLELYLLWQSASAVRCLRLVFAALQACPPDAPADLVAELIVCLEDCERCIIERQQQLPELREAAETEPNNGDAQSELAFCLNSLDEKDEAMKFHRRALQNLDSLCYLNHRDCLNNIGWDLYLRRQYEDALVWFEKACWLTPAVSHSLENGGEGEDGGPPYKLALENLLNCLAKLGRLTEASKLLTMYFERFGRLPRYETAALRKLGLDADVAYIRVRIEERSKVKGTATA
jgi:tetratricopeptide (TPR) repeat protein